MKLNIYFKGQPFPVPSYDYIMNISSVSGLFTLYRLLSAFSFCLHQKKRTKKKSFHGKDKDPEPS